MMQKMGIKREKSWKLNVKQGGYVKNFSCFSGCLFQSCCLQEKKITAWYEYTHALKVPISIGFLEYVPGFKRTLHI